jgi:hypothetical protein
LHTKGFSCKSRKGKQEKTDLEKQKAFIESYHQLLKETPDDKPIEFGDGRVSHLWQIKSAVDGI